jgi:hypothetical protein
MIFCCFVSGKKYLHSLHINLFPVVELSISRSLKHKGQNFIFIIKENLISTLNAEDSLVGTKALANVNAACRSQLASIAGSTKTSRIEAVLQHVEDFALREDH